VTGQKISVERLIAKRGGDKEAFQREAIDHWAQQSGKWIGLVLD